MDYWSFGWGVAFGVASELVLTRARTRRPATRTVGTPVSPTDEPDRRWHALVEDLVVLFDEFDRLPATDSACCRSVVAHLIDRLREILERGRVGVIADEPTFDPDRHQPDPSAATAVPGAAVAETLSPGFYLGRRVLRRARVELAHPAPEEGAAP